MLHMLIRHRVQGLGKRVLKVSMGIILAAALASSATVQDKIEKNGEFEVPGTGGKKVEYRVTGMKTGDKTAHFSLNIKNNNDQAVRMVVCAMLNFDGTEEDNQDGDNYTIQKDANNTWTCTPNGQGKRNGFHFGCTQIVVMAKASKLAFDEAIDMGRPIKGTKSIYFDVLEDHVLDSGCNQIRGKDKFTGPGTNADGTSAEGNGFNSWAGVGELFALVGGGSEGQGRWFLGNWATMGTPGTYAAQLQGTLTGAPIGTVATFNLTGDPTNSGQSFTVQSSNPLQVTLDFTIPPPEAAEGFLTVQTPTTLVEESLIRFDGQVFSTGTNPLYQAGAFMYSVGDVLIADTVAPIIQDFQLTPGPGTLNVMVAGTDATTLAAGATLLYSINGGPELEFPIPFDDPALLEDTMFFEGDLDNLPGGSTITGRAALFDDVGNLALSQPLQVTVPPVNIQLGPGWNMFSIPGTPVNTDPNSLVGPGSQIILPLYRWNPSGFSYEQVTELRLGESYWILTLNPSGETIQVPVIPASTYTASLPQGWNMIGSVSGDADFSDPQDNPDGSILPPIYFWDPIGFAYVPASTVEPGKGYWTLSLQPCTLTVTVSNSPAPPSLTGAQSQSFAQNNAPTFRFTLRVESPGESQKLVLGWDEAATGDLDRLDLVLPPVPPMGMPFDAYFEQSSFRLGRAIQPLVEGATWTMRIIADESVKLRWDKAALPDRFTLVANTPSGDVDFRSIDFLALPQGEHKITIRLKPRELPPTVSKLLPNFPNPFNPETWIPYQLSEENPVTITIYNVEGKKVRTLSLGFKLSGYYLTRDKAAYWDGRNTSGEPVASGVYFYTLKAGKFTDTRKMLILK